ncbi:MAG: tyrosine-protein phosphatase [bacterium]
MIISKIQNNKTTKSAQISFKAIEDIRNFKKIDEFVYRGGQPTKEQLLDLKKEDVKCIINFRTLFVPFIDFVEAEECQKLGIKNISIPLISKNGPSEKNVSDFFEITAKTRAEKSKIFIHCAWGKDRTGIMSALYKVKYGLDNITNCAKEMLEMGHDNKRFPDLIPTFEKIAKKLIQNS